MKANIFSSLAIAGVILMMTSCLKEPQITVHASFNTDKDVYEINEDIIVTNTSYAENGMITACKWEYGSTVVWDLNPTKPFSFTTPGDCEIRLTAVVYTDKGNIENTFVKTVKVQDTNVRPVADFSYSPSEVVAGEPVTFTDKSSDADGNITAWKWTFGSTVVTEQNPVYTFTAAGKIDVTLEVTDNQKGTGIKKISIDVQKNKFSFEKLWEKPYDNSEAFVKFTSPAVSVDGQTVYAFSSGYNLVAFDKDGNKKWTFDANKHNPSPFQSSGDKNCSSCVPAIDPETGCIFIQVGYNELSDYKTDFSHESGVYCINPDGTEKWYFGWGNARYINVIPVVVKGHVFLTTKYNPENKSNTAALWELYGNLDNGHILDKETGAFVQSPLIKRGNYGGSVAFESNGYIFTHCDDAYGGRVLVPDAGKWKHYGDNANQGSPKALGYGYESGASSQMAIDGNKVYILYTSKYSSVTGVTTSSVVYCYDVTKYVEDAETLFAPDWVCGVTGSNSRYYSDGIVVGADGTLYVTTSKSGDTPGHITAISSTGTVKWTSNADGDIAGCAAVDDKGYIYYNDRTTGKLVMIEAESGNKISEIQLATDLRSSPTISVDGTVYCVGKKDDVPTLFAVKGIAEGHSKSWSQLGGDPQKSCVKR